MHMRVAPTAADVRLNAEMSGYTMAFPVPGMYAQMQSNMASTLNIDWLLDMAREILEGRRSGANPRRSAERPGRTDHGAARRRACCIIPIFRHAGERGPFLEPAARAMFTGLEIGQGFADLMRGVFEGLCFASRDCYAAMGDIPEEVRVTGGAARSKALRLMLASTLKARRAHVSREEAGAAGAAMMAAVQQKVYPDMAACAAQWVDPLLGDSTAPDAGLAAIYDKGFHTLQRNPRNNATCLAAMMANRKEARHAS